MFYISLADFMCCHVYCHLSFFNSNEVFFLCHWGSQVGGWEAVVALGVILSTPSLYPLPFPLIQLLLSGSVELVVSIKTKNSQLSEEETQGRL